MTPPLSSRAINPKEFLPNLNRYSAGQEKAEYGLGRRGNIYSWSSAYFRHTCTAFWLLPVQACRRCSMHAQTILFTSITNARHVAYFRYLCNALALLPGINVRHFDYFLDHLHVILLTYGINIHFDLLPVHVDDIPTNFRYICAKQILI